MSAGDASGSLSTELQLMTITEEERWRAARTVARVNGTDGPETVRDLLDALGLLDVSRP